MTANKTLALLLVACTAVLLSLLSLFAKTIPLTAAHTVYYCQKALSSAAVMLPHFVPDILILSSAFVFTAGALLFVFQIVRTRLFIKRLISKRTSAPSKLNKVVGKLGLQTEIAVVVSRKQYCFCYGLLKPRICVSTSLLKRLTIPELTAVLLHETYHVKNYDPLKILLGKTAAAMFFFIPTFKEIHRHYTFSKEIAADKTAIACGYKTSLTNALDKLLTTKSPSYSLVAGLSESSDLEKRIFLLTETREKLAFQPSLPRLLFSGIVIVLLFFVLNAPVHAIAKDESSSDHSYFVCPFGGECLSSCKAEFRATDNPNFSPNRNFTPVR